MVNMFRHIRMIHHDCNGHFLGNYCRVNRSDMFHRICHTPCIVLPFGCTAAEEYVSSLAAEECFTFFQMWDMHGELSMKHCEEPNIWKFEPEMFFGKCSIGNNLAITWFKFMGVL